MNLKAIEEATIKQILTTAIGPLATLCGAVGLTLWGDKGDVL